MLCIGNSNPIRNRDIRNLKLLEINEILANKNFIFFQSSAVNWKKPSHLNTRGEGIWHPATIYFVTGWLSGGVGGCSKSPQLGWGLRMGWVVKGFGVGLVLSWHWVEAELGLESKLGINLICDKFSFFIIPIV